MKNKTIDKVKEYIKEISKTKNTPHSIAGGFALGTFLALLPTFGFGVFIGLLLLLIFKKINKIAMFIGFAIWNPFVLLALYPIELKIGNILLSNLPSTEFRVSILNQFFIYTGRFLVGSLILATLIAGILYILVLTFATIFTENRKHKTKRFFKQIIHNIKAKFR